MPNTFQGQDIPLTETYTNLGGRLVSKNDEYEALQSSRPEDKLYSQYMPLDPATQSSDWEVRRENVHIVKIIGKGAFSQVAKATALNVSGNKGETTVAIKMIKGTLL